MTYSDSLEIALEGAASYIRGDKPFWENLDESYDSIALGGKAVIEWKDQYTITASLKSNTYKKVVYGSREEDYAEDLLTLDRSGIGSLSIGWTFHQIIRQIHAAPRFSSQDWAIIDHGFSEIFGASINIDFSDFYWIKETFYYELDTKGTLFGISALGLFELESWVPEAFAASNDVAVNVHIGPCFRGIAGDIIKKSPETYNHVKSIGEDTRFFVGGMIVLQLKLNAINLSGTISAFNGDVDGFSGLQMFTNMSVAMDIVKFGD